MLFLAVLVVASVALDSIVHFCLVASAAFLPLVPVVGHTLGSLLRTSSVPEAYIPDPQLAAGISSLVTFLILFSLPSRQSSAVGWKRTKASDAIAAAANSVLRQD
jgi:hypothetical protein